MPMTVCKKTAIARALRRTVLGAAVLCLSAVPGPLDVLPAQAAESSLPQPLPDGGANLNEAWMRNGGARLYWNTLTQPRQIRMVGAAFADPAAVPELMASPQGQAEGKPAGKSSRGVAPHSINVDPNAPVRAWPHGASRSGKKDAAATVQQAKSPAGQNSAGQKPASTSPALTPPVSQQGNGKTAPAKPSATANPAPGKNGTRGGTAAAVSGQTDSATSVQPQASTGYGNGIAGGSSATSATSAASTASASPATNGGASAAAPSAASSMSLTGSGAAAGALSQTAVGPARQANDNSRADVPIPPPVPALTADDLLPPSNGAGYGIPSGEASSVRAPLP